MDFGLPRLSMILWIDWIARSDGSESRPRSQTLTVDVIDHIEQRLLPSLASWSCMKLLHQLWLIAMIMANGSGFLHAILWRDLIRRFNLSSR